MDPFIGELESKMALESHIQNLDILKEHTGTV